jgi:hypothetical protein
MEAIMEVPSDTRHALLLRSHFRIFRDVGKRVRLDEDRERRVLLLSDDDWCRWSDFSLDGPLPATPPVSVMLRRLGAATYRLAALADQPRAV